MFRNRMGVGVAHKHFFVDTLRGISILFSKLLGVLTMVVVAADLLTRYSVRQESRQSPIEIMGLGVLHSFHRVVRSERELIRN
jgi:hypothetical protein